MRIGQPSRRLGRHHAARGPDGEHAVRVARARGGAPRGRRGTRPSAAGGTRSAPWSRSARTRDTRPRRRPSTTRAGRVACPWPHRPPRARARDSDTRGAGRRRWPRRRRRGRRRARGRPSAMSSGTSTEPSALSRSVTSKRCLRSTTGLGRTKSGTKSAGILRLVRPISMRSRKPAVVRTATRAPAPLEHGVRAHGGAVDHAPHVRARDAEGRRGRRGRRPPPGCRRDGTFVTTTRPVASSIAVRSVNVPPTSMPMRNMGGMIAARRMPIWYRPARARRETTPRAASGAASQLDSSL